MGEGYRDVIAGCGFHEIIETLFGDDDYWGSDMRVALSSNSLVGRSRGGGRIVVNQGFLFAMTI